MIDLTEEKLNELEKAVQNMEIESMPQLVMTPKFVIYDLISEIRKLRLQIAEYRRISTSVASYLEEGQ